MKKNDKFFNKQTVIYTVFCITIISLVGCMFLAAEHYDKSRIICSDTTSQTEELIDALLQKEESSSKSQYSAEFFGKININTAEKEELMLLPGIGNAKADAIIAYRTNTPFRTEKDITKIKGIGDKTFEKLKDNICVD